MKCSQPPHHSLHNKFLNDRNKCASLRFMWVSMCIKSLVSIWIISLSENSININSLLTIVLLLVLLEFSLEPKLKYHIWYLVESVYYRAFVSEYCGKATYCISYYLCIGFAPYTEDLEIHAQTHRYVHYIQIPTIYSIHFLTIINHLK